MSIGFNDGPRRKWKSKLNNLNANEFIEIKSNDCRGDEQDDAAIYVVMWVPLLHASLLGHELNFTTTIQDFFYALRILDLGADGLRRDLASKK